MSGEAVIRLDRVTKAFGGHVALEDVSFVAPAGSVTGFVGRNGAGKTTALRIVLGLASADAGAATIGGGPIEDLAPGTVGVLLDPGAHPGRTGRAHLRMLAAGLGLPLADADRALDEVGLAADANRRVRGYSLGMRQRLGLAAAFLGSPRILVLDEPTNGLDPDGVAMIRTRLRELADDGGTVLVSSHNLLELEQTVDEVVVLDRRVLWAGDRTAALAGRDGGLEGLFRSVASSVAS